VIHLPETKPIQCKLEISQAATSVLGTLLYFNIFDYPLTTVEIFERSILKNEYEVKKALTELEKQNLVFCIHNFYTLQNNSTLIEKRLAANILATKSLDKAKLVAKLILCIPYVRGIMLSGSISKNYMDENSDIDYFIVTAPNRLWVCRLFFVLVQKILFLNSYKYFCYNYMVAENYLNVSDKNYFTAIEAVTILPVYNLPLYKQFLEKNKWVETFFPNYPISQNTLLTSKRRLIQTIFEKFFNNSFGEWLDVFLMKKIEAKWRKNYSKKMFEGTKNLYLTRHTAKAHVGGHHNRIMAIYESKKKEYEEKFNIQFAKSFI
jgi:hypothetical protein